MYKLNMEPLTAAEAAARLNISVRRVQQLVKEGRLPATQFGGALMIQAKDLKLVENRKPGRPPKHTADDKPKNKNSTSRKRPDGK
jgi:excisionase family DNA binding protein